MKTIFIFPFLLALLFLSACADFLDKSPDSRVELDSPELIAKLLIDGYSTNSYSLIGELSSDNFIDNNSPDEAGVFYHLSSRDRLHDELFAWQPGVSSQDSDSPSGIWNGFYHAIAVSNQALQSIKKVEEKGKGSDVQRLKGEALLIRAYHHFILSNIFCQTFKNDITSKNDSGIPYITVPEDKVLVHYRRTTVKDNYDNIEKDLLEGLDLIEDTHYDVPKYHFNKKAAYAFAARFYLFKRNYSEVVKYANLALGSNASEKMRNWNAEYPTYYSFADGWINASSQNNFLLMSTYSVFNRIFGTRYGHSREATQGSILGTGPTWQAYRFNPCYNGRLFVRGEVEYGVFFPKCGEYFEYTDKIAGIGYPHVVRAEFTGEETLLCRAEAYIYLNQIANAVADLKTFDDSHKISGYNYADLTESLIKSFYTSNKTLFVKQFNTEMISSDFVVSPSNKPFIDCVLHFRRIETMFDGMRWFDIKRYGIQITHKIDKTQIEILTPLDPRRAIQIPAEVISAGLTPNFRLQKSNTDENIQVSIPIN